MYSDFLFFPAFYFLFSQIVGILADDGKKSSPDENDNDKPIVYALFLSPWTWLAIVVIFIMLVVFIVMKKKKN